MAWWEPIAIARPRSGSGLRSEASARFEKGADPDDHRRWPRAASPSCSRPRGATLAAGVVDVARRRCPIARAGPRADRARSTRMLGTDARRATQIARLPRADRLHASTRGRRRPRRRRARRSASTPRPRSTSSRRSPATTATTASARPCRASPLAGGLTPRQRDRRARARALLAGCGCDEAMPMPFLAPGDLERGRLAGEAISRHQPARRRGVGAAHVAAPGPAQGDRATTSRTAASALRCSRSATSTVPAADEPRCPTSASMLGVALGGARGARGRRGRGTALVDALGLAAIDRRSTAELPGLHPTRGRAHRGRRRARSARSARSIPACSTPTASPSGWRGSRSTSTRCSACRTASEPLPPGQPVPVERHRPGLRGRRRRAPPRDVEAHAARGRRRRCSSTLRAVRRVPRRRGGRGQPQPGVPPAAPGHRPHAHRRRGRRGPPRCIDAVEARCRPSSAAEAASARRVGGHARAWQLTELGDPLERLDIVEVDDPVAGPGAG